MSDIELDKLKMHYYYIEMANYYGVEEAIMLNHLIYWIATNSMNRNNYIEDRYWTYSTIEDFKKYFTYWTTSQIRRILKSLATQGAIVRGNHNKCKYDRTIWYCLNDEEYFLTNFNPIDKIEEWKDQY